MNKFSDACDILERRATEYDSSLQLAKHANAELRKSCKAMSQALREMQQLFNTTSKCCVCYTRNVDSSCLPCRHCFCSRCAQRAQSNHRCHVCRQDVTEHHRIFYDCVPRPKQTTKKNNFPKHKLRPVSNHYGTQLGHNCPA